MLIDVQSRTRPCCHTMKCKIIPVVFGVIAFLAVFIVGNAVVGPTVCRDGWPSASIGNRGACSHHRGVNRGPQALAFVLSIIVGFSAYAGVKRLRQRTAEAGGVIAAIRNAHQSSQARSQIRHLPCPICGGGMLTTLERQGPNAARWFLICSRFPECRGFVDPPGDESKPTA